MEQAAAGEGGGPEEVFRDTYHYTRLLLIEREDDDGQVGRINAKESDDEGSSGVIVNSVFNYSIIIVVVPQIVQSL